MKMYLISDNVDTYTGMRLAGVDGVVVHERDELREALEKVLTDKTVGVVLLTEKFGREFPDILDQFRLDRKLPLLVEIPDRHGTGREKLYHILCYRSDWLEIVGKGGNPLDAGRKNRTSAGHFDGGGPRGGKCNH